MIVRITRRIVAVCAVTAALTGAAAVPALAAQQTGTQAEASYDGSVVAAASGRVEIVTGPFKFRSSCQEVIRLRYNRTDYYCADGSAWGSYGWWIVNP